MQNVLYYSTNTFLAYKIAEKYFSDLHYLWCSPQYNCPENPPSSNPKELYRRLSEEVLKHDNHSSKIRENRCGLKKAALIKRNSGQITDIQFKEILALLHAAKIHDFKPLLYIIPAEHTKGCVTMPPLKKKASTFSKEFILNIPREHFDIIEL